MRFINKLKEFINVGLHIWKTAAPMQLSAALAYYGMMSLPPLLLVLYTLGWYLLEDVFLAGRVASGAGLVLPPDLVTLLNEAVLAAVPTDLGGNWFYAIIGIILLLVTASGLFLNLQSALNRIWEAPPSRHHGIVNFIGQRFVAILMLFGLAAVIIVPMRLEFELAKLEPELGVGLPVHSVDEFAIFLFLALVLAIIYKGIPNLPIAWRDVLIAALVVSILVLLGVVVVLDIIGSTRVRTPFQVFSLLTLILVSVNYLSLIVVMGGVFSRCFASVFGSMKDELLNERGA